jgi:hypothetical protein
MCDREPVERLEIGSDVIELPLSEHKAGCVVLYALQSVGGGERKTSEKRVAIVKARQNERDSKFGGGVVVQVFPDQTDAADVEVAGASSGRDKVGHRERGVEDDPKVFCRVRERYRGVVKLQVERRRELREFLACANQHGFSLVVVQF